MVRIFKKKKAPLLTTIYSRPCWAAGVGQSAQMCLNAKMIFLENNEKKHWFAIIRKKKAPLMTE